MLKNPIFGEKKLAGRESDPGHRNDNPTWYHYTTSDFVKKKNYYTINYYQTFIKFKKKRGILYSTYNFFRRK